VTNRAEAPATVLIENEQVRVTRYEFEPGQETGWHRHLMDYTVAAITECTMLIETDDGPQNASTEQGDSYFRKAGVRYNVVNDGNGLVALSFRSLNSFMRPFVRMPRGFCLLTRSGAGAGYRTH
jgi:quercetin dioxygenase-like cupin family protein